MLKPEHQKYLEGRAYTPALIAKEDIHSITGRGRLEGIDLGDGPERIAWVCRTGSGKLAGIQTREIEEKRYRWFQAENTGHLPPLYGSAEDHRRAHEQEQVILTEGIFDRTATKRWFPEMAVLARLSKGISNQLIHHLRRHVKTVWLMFDEDEPGSKAATTAELRLSDHLNVYRLRYPAKDPSLLWQRKAQAAATELKKQMIALGD
jgi:DNA primase